MPDSSEPTAPGDGSIHNRSGRLRAAVVFVVVWAALTGVAVVWQSQSGAYESDFGSHPDEASHFITGLMVRDYLLDGIPGNPMAFAKDYYAHYPKVALGHYPPGFYLAEGIWLSVFPVAKWSVLAFLAVQAGLLGALIFSVSSRRAGFLVGFLAGAVAVSLPITQILTATVMSDLLLSLMCFLAVIAFARFLGGGRWQDSLWFGIWATAATMVKGSGLLLAVLVPIAILISKRWDLIKRPALWLGAVPVVLIAGPWMAFTRKITAEGMVEKGIGEHLAEVIPYFAVEWARWIGFLISLLVAFAVVSAIRRREFRGDPVLVCLSSFPLALVLFYALIPAGLAPRYLMPAIAPVMVLASVGAREVATFFKTVPAWVPATALFAFLVLEMVRPTEKEGRGWAEIADHIIELEKGKPTEILVVSDARGEGALMAEMALRDPARPSHEVLRGSKVLASSDWLGRDYKGAFGSRIELGNFLNERNFRWVLFDATVPDRLRKPYHDQLELLLGSGDEGPLLPAQEFPIKRQRGASGEADLYRAKIMLEDSPKGLLPESR